MKPFEESDRYVYPLTETSLVWDVGGFEGNFSKEIYRRYGAHVCCFEPVFTGRVITALDHLYPVVVVLPYGLGATTRKEKMRIKGDSTGMFADSGDEIEVEIRNISTVLRDPIDLLKLNCEGAEFEILEALIARGEAKEFANIQVQFHPIVENYNQRYHAISDGLSKTHKLTYHAPWCWENWERL